MPLQQRLLQELLRPQPQPWTAIRAHQATAITVMPWAPGRAAMRTMTRAVITGKTMPVTMVTGMQGRAVLMLVRAVLVQVR